MKLVVMGRESLDELAAMVVSKFSSVPNKELEPPSFGSNTIEPEKLGTQVYFKPVKDLRTLEIIIPIPDQEDHWRSKPGHILGHFIGHEGRGSILSYLKRQGWCNNLISNSQAYARGFGFYQVKVDLTEGGLKNYKQVVAAVFDYIDLLRQSIDQQGGSLPLWALQEAQQLTNLHWSFQSKRTAGNTVMQACEDLHKNYPPEWTLSGSKIREFDMTAIRTLLDQLRLDRSRIFLSAQQLPPELTSGPDAVPETNERERWYGTEYCISPLPKWLFDPSRPRTPELALPDRNPFVPQDLSVRRPMRPGVSPPAQAAIPALLSDTDQERLWFQPDLKFGQPKAYVAIRLTYAKTEWTARDRALNILLARALNDDLNEYGYDAEMAGLSYRVSTGTRSLWVTVAGYNDKQTVLLQTVLQRLKTLQPDATRLAAIVDRLRRSLSDFALSEPYRQAITYVKWFCHDTTYLPPETLAQIQDVQPTDVAHFRDLVLGRCHHEVYVHGNYEANDALALRDLVQRNLPATPLAAHEHNPGPHSLLLPPSTELTVHLTPQDPAEVNSSLIRFAQLGAATIDDVATRAALGLLVHMGKQPTFDTLRTTQQLGYIVQMAQAVHDNSLGVYIIAQSEYDVNAVRARSQEFLREVMAPLLRKMTHKTFAARRAAYAATFHDSKSLGEETNRIFGAIEDNTYDFAYHKRLAEAVRATSLETVQHLFGSYVHPDSAQRSVLNIQIESPHAKPLSPLAGLANASGEAKDGAQESKDQATEVDGLNATLLEARSVEEANNLRAQLHQSKPAVPIRPWSEFAGASDVPQANL